MNCFALPQARGQTTTQSAVTPAPQTPVVQDAVKVPLPISHPDVPPVVEAKEPGALIAQGRGLQLSAGELALSINQQLPWFRRTYAQPYALEFFAHALVEMKLLAKEARRQNMHRDPALVQYVDLILAQALLTQHLQKIDKSKPTPADLRQYYQEHLEERFTRPERVRVSGIVTSDSELAKRVLRWSAKANTKRFGKLAKKYSELRRPYPPGSDEGWVLRTGDRTDPQIVLTAYTMKKAGQTALVQDAEGRYWVLRYEGRQGRTVLPYSEVEYALASLVRRERESKARTDLVRPLLEKAKVHYRAVDELVQSSGPTTPSTSTPTPSKQLVPREPSVPQVTPTKP